MMPRTPHHKQAQQRREIVDRHGRAGTSGSCHVRERTDNTGAAGARTDTITPKHIGPRSHFHRKEHDLRRRQRYEPRHHSELDLCNHSS